MIPFGFEYNTELAKNYLPKNYEIDTVVDYQKCYAKDTTPTIITIGDSYSNYYRLDELGLCGYNNYLAYLFDYKVINIDRQDENPAQEAVYLLNSRLLDSISCKTFILEIGSRLAIERLCTVDFDNKVSQYNESAAQRNAVIQQDKKEKRTKLYQFCSWLRLLINYDTPIVKYDLNGNYFSHKRFSNQLFVAKWQFPLPHIESQIDKAKENLVLLDKKFAGHGIKFIFLIAAMNNDLYQPFITNDLLMADNSTDALSETGVCVLDTKPLLQKMVAAGVKDVFMVNDPHWSYKASIEIAKEINKFLPPNNLTINSRSLKTFQLIDIQ
jgi:hypothetical protein